MIERIKNSVSALLLFSMLAGAAACGAESRPREENRSYELVALDQRAGRAALINHSGQTIVLELNSENDDGLRLISISPRSALIDVRFKHSGDLIAYRINIGETVDVRPPPLHRSGGVRAVSITPMVANGAVDEAPAKDEETP